MSDVGRVLDQVERLIDAVKVQQAEDLMKSLMSMIPRDDLLSWQVDLRRTIEKFLPKRRRRLLELLAGTLEGSPSSEREGPLPEPGVRKDAQTEAGRVLRSLEQDLGQLSEHHIFQWATFYRDILAQHFAALLRLVDDSTAKAVSEGVSGAIASHADAIFQKGFNYLAAQARGPVGPYAIVKSLSGLQRFIDLPIELYSTKLTSALTPRDGQALRLVTSSMLAGILNGYSTVYFRGPKGKDVLLRNPRSWAHAVPFLTADDLEQLAKRLEPGELPEGLQASVLPTLRALDKLAADASDYIPLPTLALVQWERRRLDVSLQPPTYAAEPHPVEIQMYLDGSYVDRGSLTESLSRNIALVVADIGPALVREVESEPRLKRLVVAPVMGAGASTTERKILDVLEYAIYQRTSPRAASVPLAYNFARNFPLHNPFLTRYFHVHRSSVRELLRTFERRNGVRLWCSVRRSGKTTACLDLGTSTGGSAVVSQTCDSTGQIPGGNLFYDAVAEALGSGDQLSSNFFVETVERAAGGIADVSRYVFVLDEYETLFGRLQASARRDPDLRYTVVQPLLNQMVGFARDNLLVFLGQQPTAHYIFMDQNQLSAYVEQDVFPLFRHEGSNADEFGELVRKVLTDQVRVQSAFVDALYNLTAGHPFLTVNVLVEVVEWLIRQRRPLSSLILTGEDFDAFAAKALRPRAVSMSKEFVFFREAIGEAIGSYGKKENPWLYCIYSCLRELAREAPDSLSIPRSDFDGLVSKLELESLGYTANYILETGQQANFFLADEQRVGPRIPMLARVAGSARRRVSA